MTEYDLNYLVHGEDEWGLHLLQIHAFARGQGRPFIHGQPSGPPYLLLLYFTMSSSCRVLYMFSTSSIFPRVYPVR
jgi:hypothetical protein